MTGANLAIYLAGDAIIAGSSFALGWLAHSRRKFKLPDLRELTTISFTREILVAEFEHGVGGPIYWLTLECGHKVGVDRDDFQMAKDGEITGLHCASCEFEQEVRDSDDFMQRGFFHRPRGV